MRRTVITEDMISRALNESIDEFMLEEGEGWNRFKNKLSSYGSAINNGLKRLGNTKFMRGLNNAVNMYMDYKTNGQWNREYNSYARDEKGNNNRIGSFYLDKWLNKHYRTLQDIAYGEKYGNKLMLTAEINGEDVTFSRDWTHGCYYYRDMPRNVQIGIKLNHGEPSEINVIDLRNNSQLHHDDNPPLRRGNSLFAFKDVKPYDKDLVIKIGEDDRTVESYIDNDCNFQNYLSFVKNSIGNGTFNQAVKFYIAKVIVVQNNKNKKAIKDNEMPDYETTINLFTIENFWKWYHSNKNQFEGYQQEENDANERAAQEAEAQKAQQQQQKENERQQRRQSGKPAPTEPDGRFKASSNFIVKSENGIDWYPGKDANGDDIYVSKDGRRAVYAKK